MTSARRVLFVSALVAYIAFQHTTVKTQNAAPSVSIDHAAYVAGEMVTIAGRDFATSEIVTVQVTHADGTAEPGMGHEPATRTVGADGTFQVTWVVNGVDLSGPQLTVNVAGDVSGVTAPVPFARTAAVSTDKGDYQPGDTAFISASGFAPNEPVALQVVHANG